MARRSSKTSKASNVESISDDQPHYVINSDVCPLEQDGPDEPMVLETKGSRLGTAVGSWIFALFWNAICWTITYFVVRDFNWFATIFMSVFVLVGIATIIFSIYSTLQIWNPKTTVVCSQRNLYPGSEFEISWLHQGNPSSISELSIVLEGEETATYRQGTTTRTDKSVFYKQNIVTTAEQKEISEGFRLVALPDDTMHSFKGARNEITWQIRVHGKIRFWPDIDDAYAVTIYPPRIEGVANAEA